MILWSFLGFILIRWLAALQRDFTREQEDRRARQRRRRLGIEPIPGADGRTAVAQARLDAEEQRLMALLRTRQLGAEGG